MSATRHQLSALRQTLAKIEAGADAARPQNASENARKNAGDIRIALDQHVLDAATGGGLLRASLHEVVAERLADAPATRGFAAAVALRANALRGRTIVWVEDSQTRREIGALSPDGLNALGLDPSTVLHVKARDAVTALRATAEAARCTAVAAVVSVIWGAPKALGLDASRRLRLVSQRSGVTVVMARLCTPPHPSAAETRWRVAALPSSPAPANAPGYPAFSLTLLRHRHGTPAGPWPVEWNADDRLFHVQDLRQSAAGTGHAPLSGDRVAASGDRQIAPHARQRLLRLAG